MGSLKTNNSLTPPPPTKELLSQKKSGNVRGHRDNFQGGPGSVRLWFGAGTVRVVPFFLVLAVPLGRFSFVFQYSLESGKKK